jgi:hypothetical protein
MGHYMNRIIAIFLCVISYNFSYGENINSDNFNQFKRMSLLKSVLDNCSDNGIDFEDEKSINAIISFNKFLIKKNKIDADIVVKTITESEIMVQNQFEDVIPANICFDAIEYTMGLINSSNEFNNK